MPRESKSRTAGRANDHADIKTATVRIIGGQWRGRRLTYTADPRTRPMKDRVREAVFNLLGELQAAAAIDLFAGTGALGFEALSRGAEAAVFFERHFPTAELIRRHAAAFDATDRCHVQSADTFAFFRRGPALPPLVGPRRWVVFCSPPFELYESRRDEMLALIAQLCAAAPADSAFVVEADERFDFSLLPESLRWDARRYPPAQIAVGWKSADPSSIAPCPKPRIDEAPQLPFEADLS